MQNFNINERTTHTNREQKEKKVSRFYGMQQVNVVILTFLPPHFLITQKMHQMQIYILYAIMTKTTQQVNCFCGEKGILKKKSSHFSIFST